MRTFISIALLTATGLAFYAGTDPYAAGKVIDAIRSTVESIIRAM